MESLFWFKQQEAPGRASSLDIQELVKNNVFANPAMVGPGFRNFFTSSVPLPFWTYEGTGQFSLQIFKNGDAIISVRNPFSDQMLCMSNYITDNPAYYTDGVPGLVYVSQLITGLRENTTYSAMIWACNMTRSQYT